MTLLLADFYMFAAGVRTRTIAPSNAPSSTEGQAPTFRTGTRPSLFVPQPVDHDSLPREANHSCKQPLASNSYNQYLSLPHGLVPSPIVSDSLSCCLSHTQICQSLSAPIQDDSIPTSSCTYTHSPHRSITFPIETYSNDTAPKDLQEEEWLYLHIKSHDS